MSKFVRIAKDDNQWQVLTSNNGTNWLVVFGPDTKTKCQVVLHAFLSVGYQRHQLTQATARNTRLKPS